MRSVPGSEVPACGVQSRPPERRRTLPLTDHGKLEQKSCVFEKGRSVGGAGSDMLSCGRVAALSWGRRVPAFSVPAARCHSRSSARAWKRRPLDRAVTSLL